MTDDASSFVETRKLDAEVAREVMGAKVYEKWDGLYADIPAWVDGSEGKSTEVKLTGNRVGWSPSNCDEHAIQVIRRTEKVYGWVWGISTMRNGRRGRFVSVSYPEHRFSSGITVTGWVEGDTLAAAICKASLRAMASYNG